MPEQMHAPVRSSAANRMTLVWHYRTGRYTSLWQMKVHLITTGGTIEKIYSERTGQVENLTAKIDRYLHQLRLPDARIDVTPLMNKDSLEMTEEDRELVLEAVKAKVSDGPVVITHGTDTMVETGRLLKQRLGDLRHPVVMTGAMTPLGF